MLAGLCNLCDDFGHQILMQCAHLHRKLQPCLGVALIIFHWQRSWGHTKLSSKENFQSWLGGIQRTWNCAWDTLGSCSDEHPGISVDFTVFYDACETLSVSLENCEAKRKAKRKEKLHEAVNTHCDYVGHLICTRHQADYYQYVLRNLKLGECVVVLD